MEPLDTVLPSPQSGDGPSTYDGKLGSLRSQRVVSEVGEGRREFI